MTNSRHRWGTATFTIQNEHASPFTVSIKGRRRWALECLIDAGVKGCTPIDTPGPRWSAYTFSLKKSGIQIETNHEPHAGSWPGTHARYVLKSHVSLSDNGEVAA